MHQKSTPTPNLQNKILHDENFLYAILFSHSEHDCFTARARALAGSTGPA